MYCTHSTLCGTHVCPRILIFTTRQMLRCSIWPSQILTSSLWRRTLRQPAVCLATANRSLQVLATTGKFHWSHMVNGNTSNCIWELSFVGPAVIKATIKCYEENVLLVRLAVNIPLNAKLLEICILALNIYKFL